MTDLNVEGFGANFVEQNGCDTNCFAQLIFNIWLARSQPYDGASNDEMDVKRLNILLVPQRQE